MNILGRPRALTEIKKREVCALLAAGGTMRFAGDYVGCSVKTIRNEADRDPEFGRDIHEAQLSAQLEPLRALRRKATTHWRAAAWLLERSRPEHFARLGLSSLPPAVAGSLHAAPCPQAGTLSELPRKHFASSESLDRLIRHHHNQPSTSRAEQA